MSQEDRIDPTGKPDISPGIPGANQPCQSIAAAIAFSARDWALDHRDAWIYGIVLGWDETLPDVAERHRWTPETVKRLEMLREMFLGLLLMEQSGDAP